MQKDQTVCKGRRTWQSMKENFHKQIVPQLHIYKNVNNKVANCFKRVFEVLGWSVFFWFSIEDEDCFELSLITDVSWLTAKSSSGKMFLLGWLSIILSSANQDILI